MPISNLMAAKVTRDEIFSETMDHETLLKTMDNLPDLPYPRFRESRNAEEDISNVLLRLQCDLGIIKGSNKYPLNNFAINADQSHGKIEVTARVEKNCKRDNVAEAEQTINNLNFFPYDLLKDTPEETRRCSQKSSQSDASTRAWGCNNRKSPRKCCRENADFPNSKFCQEQRNSEQDCNSQQERNLPPAEGIFHIVENTFSTPKGLHEIAGLEDVKQTLRESIIYPLKYPHLFTNGRQMWSRALLFGPPGVGKTVIVQAAAAEARLPLYQVSSADVMSAWLGNTEKQIRQLFTQLGAEKCILFMDEIDAFCRKRGSNDSEHTRRLQTEFMIQMQNYEGAGMFLICATNCPWDLDPAFLRRFQQRIYVPLPDFDARETLVLSNLYLGKLPTVWEGWSAFINATEGLTGSDIKNIIRAAMMFPMREMQTATYWRRTIDGKFIPSAKDSFRAVNCSLNDLPADRVWCRDINMSDLRAALSKCSRTVTDETIAPFKKFITEHII